MSSRTEPTDAIERLAWALNYHQGESISINSLAEKTGLSWATTKKYTQLLEVLNRISPDVSATSDGVKVNKIGDNLDSLKQEKDLQLAIYILQHASIDGESDDSISKDRHSDVLEKYSAEIEEIEENGWIESTDDTVRITPEGASIAGPARSEYRNTDVEKSTAVPEVKIIDPTEWNEAKSSGNSTDWEGPKKGTSGPRSEYTGDEFERAENVAVTQ
jgi:predicted transcriptional regulator